MNVVDVSEDDLPAVTAFLLRSPETSLFLLSNLRAFGHRLGPSLYSGDFKAIRDGDALVAVFCIARSGTIVLQTAGRRDAAPIIVHTVRNQEIPIRGVIGEWRAASAVWALLAAEDVIAETLASKEVLYRLSLDRPLPPVSDGPLIVRRLTLDDHDQWAALSVAFHEEMRLPVPGEREQRKASFARSTGLGHWWGGFEGTRLVSMTAIVALHERLAQIGGVYTVPERRRRGYNRAVMGTVVRDARLDDLERLFLFTGETNVSARSLYESLGFEPFGHFGLFFGEPKQR